MTRSQLQHDCEICGSTAHVYHEDEHPNAPIEVKCAACFQTLWVGREAMEEWARLATSNVQAVMSFDDEGEGLNLAEQKNLLKIAQVQQQVIEKTWKILFDAGLGEDLKDIAGPLKDVNLSLEMYEIKITE